jgi:hypothetical protein
LQQPALRTEPSFSRASGWHGSGNNLSIVQGESSPIQSGPAGLALRGTILGASLGGLISALAFYDEPSVAMVITLGFLAVGAAGGAIAAFWGRRR